MNSLKLLLKCLAAMSTSLVFLNSAISANAECTTGLWSADWEVKLTSAYGGFETLADDKQNVYAMGASQSSSSNGSIIVKYDKDGVELWRHTYSEPGNTQTSPIAFEFDNKGNINVLALAFSSSEAVTYSLTPDGVLRWGYAYSNADLPIINPRDLATDTKGNSYVTGTISNSGTSNSKDIFLIKVNKNDVFQWAQQYDGPDGLSDQVSDMEVDSKGAVIIVGHSFSGRAILKYDKNGNSEWTNMYTTKDAIERDVQVDHKKNIYILG